MSSAGRPEDVTGRERIAFSARYLAAVLVFAFVPVYLLATDPRTALLVWWATLGGALIAVWRGWYAYRALTADAPPMDLPLHVLMDRLVKPPSHDERAGVETEGEQEDR